jgi:hypothetical protein
MIDNDKAADEGSTTSDRDDLHGEIEKLRAKNKELLAEKQKAKQKAQEAQDAADDAVTQAAERNGDIEALKTAHAAELKKLQAKLDNADTDLRTIRIDNEIARAISEGNVRTELAKGFDALMRSQVKYDNGSATIESEPVADYIKTYLASGEGAHYRRVADHNGTGAPGNTTTNLAPKITKRPTTPAELDALDAMPDAERNALVKSMGWDDLAI